MNKESVNKVAHNIVERMITNGFLGEEDEKDIQVTFDWVKEELLARLESERIESLELYPKNCEATGKGIFSGFLIGDCSTLSDGQEERLLEHCKEEGYETLEDAYEDEFYYWTEWDCDMEELEFQCYAYDAEGQEYNYDELTRNWSKAVYNYSS